MTIAEFKTIKMQDEKTCGDCGHEMDESGICPSCGNGDDASLINEDDLETLADEEEEEE